MLALLLLVLVPIKAQDSDGPQTIAGCQFQEYQDLDNNNLDDTLYLLCDFDLSGQYSHQLIIRDRDNDLDIQQPWSANLDDQDDIWFFDYGNDGNYELIIDFDRQQFNSLRGRLYDEIPPGLDVSPENWTDLETLNPSIIITTLSNFWMRDDSTINHNLDIIVDTDLIAAFISEEEVQNLNFIRDGQPDYTIRIRDIDDDGRPDYDWRTLNIHEELEVDNFVKTYLAYNAIDDETTIRPVLPFPYIGPITYRYNTSSPAATGQPPIQMDWEQGSLQWIGEFVTTRGNDNQWFVYSRFPLEPGQVNPANFEAPFAYYNIAEDDDDIPELAIRHVYYAAYDPTYLEGGNPKTVNEIRYSWDQNNDNQWDYKLGLIGSHVVNNIVNLNEVDLRINIPAYDTLPTWVRDKDWDIVTFVSAEEGARGEGIYEWDVPPQVTENYYLFGRENPLPFDDNGQYDLRSFRYSRALTDDPMAIDPGFRGEFQFELNSQPVLYINGIDQKVHLYRAERSIWNLDGTTNIETTDGDGDGYFDSWVKWAMIPSIQPITEETSLDAAAPQTEVLEQIYFINGHLIYIDGTQIEIKPVAQQENIATVQMPTNNAEWQTLNETLALYQTIPDSSDLRSLFDYQDAVGEVVTLNTTSLTQLNIAEAHFSAIVEITETQDISALGTTLEPGYYFLLLDANNTLQINPLEPADITAHLDADVLPASGVVQYDFVPLDIIIDNTGFEDVVLEIAVYTQFDDETGSVLYDRDVIRADGDSTITYKTLWQPFKDGTATLRFDIRAVEDQERLLPSDVSTSLETTITVLPSNFDESVDLLSLNDRLAFSGVGVPILLLATAVFTAAFFILLFLNRLDV